MKKSILFLVAVGAGAVHSFTTNTWNNANSGNTPATAYDWSAPDNWSLGAVPGADTPDAPVYRNKNPLRN